MSSAAGDRSQSHPSTYSLPGAIGSEIVENSAPVTNNNIMNNDDEVDRPRAKGEVNESQQTEAKEQEQVR